jgi:hypothetical protein
LCEKIQRWVYGCYAKLDQFLDFLVARYGWSWLEQPTNAWRTKYPHVTKKIDELEARINQLEKSSTKPTTDVGNYQDG